MEDDLYLMSMVGRLQKSFMWYVYIWKVMIKNFLSVKQVSDSILSNRWVKRLEIRYM